jgi:hypothetical protein
MAVVALAAAVMLAVAGCSSGNGGSGSGGGGAGTTAGGGDGGYGGGGQETTTSGGAAGGAGSGETTLTAQGLKWSETALSLPKGTTSLKVVNSDSVEHSFTSEQLNVDQDIEGGEDADVTLDLSNVSGSVAFHCKYHPSIMKGTIQVTG